MNGYEGVFGLLLKACERKERERIERREREREARMDERMAELLAMAEEVAHG